VRIDDVAVAGVGMVRFGKYPDRSGPALARDAALAARLAAYRRRLADEVDERARRVAAQMKSGEPPKSGT